MADRMDSFAAATLCTSLTGGKLLLQQYQHYLCNYVTVPDNNR